MWLDGRQRVEGPGFRLGNLELHPGIGVEGGYDSNVFLSDTNPQGSALLLVRPHIYVSTLGPERREEGEDRGPPPKVAFRGGASAGYHHFFIDAARSNVEIDTDLRVTVFPERQFSFTIFDTYSRLIRPFTNQGAIDRNYNRNRNEIGTEFVATTKGGGLRGNVGYAFGFDLFEGETFQYANNVSHRVDAGSSWRFLPRTSLVYDFRFTHNDWINSDQGSPVLLSDANRLRSRIGVNGAVTSHLSVLGMVGHAAGFMASGLADEYSSVVGQAEARWHFTPTANVGLGYDRDFFFSVVGNFHRRDRGYLNMSVLLARVFVIGAEAWVGYLDFGRVVDVTGAPLGADGTTDRKDLVVGASLSGEYRLASWLGITTRVGYLGDFSDFEFARVTTAGLVPDPVDFQKFEVWGGLRASY